MPRLDFKEIAQGNLANGEQDSFELFARDFLETLGYEIISEPNRGRDGGKDLIVLETRFGIGGKTFIKWLVSCKHKAHSGKSVNVTSDEQDIFDRVKSHNCNGFIGFYSTLPASSLTEKLEGIKKANPFFEFQLLDKEKIETKLLTSPEFLTVIQKYFPFSFKALHLENFGLNLAVSRFGMPQPILFKLPNEDRTLTVDEVMKLYPQGNQFGWHVWSAQFIFFNNVLGITKILPRGEDFREPTSEDLAYWDKAMQFQIEHLREEYLKEQNSAKED